MQRSEFLRAVLAHGESAQSFLGTYSTYRHQSIDGATIAYVAHKDTWILAGPPIAPPEGAEKAYASLVDFADREKVRLLAVALNSKEAQRAKKAGFGALWIGRDPWIDLDRLNPSLARFPQAKRLAASGATVKMLNPLKLTSDERRAINRLHDEWLDSRKMPPLGFLNQIQLWEGEEHRRYFQLSVETHGERSIVAALIAVPAPAANTWYLIDLLRGKHAPNGTSELLLHQAMVLLKAEGAKAVNLGVAPLSGAQFADLGEEGDRDESGVLSADSGTNAPKHTGLYRLFRVIHERMDLFYGFKTLAEFKEKMNPSRWEPSYLCYYPAQLSPNDARALAAAFLPDGTIYAFIVTLIRWVKTYPIGAELSRHLRADLFTRESPDTAAELWHEAKITHYLMTSLIVIHVIAMIFVSSGGVLNLHHHWGFDYLEPFKARGASLLAAPFLHWDEIHLLTNLAMIGVFGAIIEVLLGRAFFFATFVISATAGQALSALLYAAYGSSLMRLPFAADWIAKLPLPSSLIDIGASLGACGLAGALAWCLTKGWILGALIVAGSVIACVQGHSLVPLNHVVAAFVGAFLARGWFMHVSTLLPSVTLFRKK